MILLKFLALAWCCHTANSFLVGILSLPLDPLLDCNLNLIYLPLLVCGNARCRASSCSNGGACREFNDKNVFKGYTCDCPAGWYGANCHIEALGCGHIKKINPKAASGVYWLRQLLGGVVSTYPCYCNMDDDDGGWTRIQQRVDGSVSFNRNWNDYVNGFGNYNGNFWIGLTNLYRWTNARRYELLVVIKDKNGNVATEKYDNFRVGSAASFYKLESLGASKGLAGNSMTDALGKGFSTPDADHDIDAYSCAKSFRAGWWYSNCYYCNPNGLYGSDTSYGIVWYTWRGFGISMPYISFYIREW